MQLPDKSILSNYKPNPVARAFHLDPHPIKGMMGPVGCGKTTDCLMHIFIRACQMPKNGRGKRYSRWAIIRDTYPNLQATTLKSAVELWPEHIFGRYKRTYPIEWPIRFNDVELDLLFMAIGSADDLSKLLSLELTGIYGNELSTLPKEVVVDGYDRTGRMPKKSDFISGYDNGVIFDTNPPDDDSWQYNYFEIESQTNSLFSLYKHPPGLIKDANNSWITNPDASNLANLRDGYYTDMIQTRSPESLKVYALGEYGSSKDGKLVYPQYNDRFHYSSEILEADPTRPIYIGADFGLNPTLIIVQFIDGAVRILDEITSSGTNLRELLDNVAMPFLREKYYGYQVKGWGDPAGAAKATGEGRFCLELLQDYGLDIQAAPTNEIQPRIDAVVQYLTKMPGGNPGLLISRNCVIVRKSMSVNYVYERMRILGSAGEIKFKDKPAKNNASHPMDALQYVCLGYNDEIIYNASSNNEPRIVQSDW